MNFHLASLIGIYLIFCLLVAYYGRDVAIGFGGVLIVSIFLTPFLTALFIVLFRPKFKRKSIDEWANEE